MRANLRSGASVSAHIRKQAVAVPGAAALTVRPHPVTGQAEALVVCHLGVCPLHLSDSQEYVRLEPPLTLRNQIASKFSVRHVHDAVYDRHSRLVLFAHGTSIYGLDATNRVLQLTGDDEGGLLCDGTASEARFVGVQRLVTDGAGVTYIRDRDSRSRNGFCLRTLYEATAPCGTRGSGVRAVVTVNIGGDMGPACMTFDSWRDSLLFTTRGNSVHQLLSYGITEELLGTDEPAAPSMVAAVAAAAAASASASATDTLTDDEEPPIDVNGRTSRASSSSKLGASMAQLTNVQALVADPGSGNVYILDGISGSRTQLRVLRPDGSLDTLDEQLRIGPTGNSRFPRMAVLPYGHLAVYGTADHEMMLLKL